MKNKNNHKKAFIQIFLGYFISVNIFVLILGFLYFNQQKVFVLQNTAMQMHQYFSKLKQSNFLHKQYGYSFEFSKNNIIKKQLPKKQNNYYYKVFKKGIIIKIDSNIIDKKIYKIKVFTIFLQIFLVLLFGLISFVLTKRSLKPMLDTISHLDRFTKDLIHDLNTPVTSILLNTRMLKKELEDKSNNKIKRIETSAKTISALYENLEVLLNGNLKKDKVKLNNMINSLIDTYKQLYTHINFTIIPQDIIVNTNKNVIKRILDNIISNACKYSKDKNANITINFSNNTLVIEDNGKGIIYPNKIFEREYKESTNGHGIGMHIVYRLCDELDHDINIQSEQNIGTIVQIKFN